MAEFDEAVAEEFGRRRKKQFLVTIPAICAAIGIGWLRSEPDAAEHEYHDVVMIASFAVLAGVIVFSFFNWRCPGCRKYLGRGFTPKHCPGCGVPLS